MNQQELSPDEASNFLRRANEQRLNYLKLIKSVGCPVDDLEIASLESEMVEKDKNPKPEIPDVLKSCDVNQLQSRLALVDLIYEGNGSAIKLLLLRLQNTIVRMRPDKNHELAHFHIEYREEYSASYSIEPLKILAGQLPARYEKPVLDWASEHKESLILTWKKLKAGENVTEMIIAAGEEKST
jgi:hypothetical protein